MRRPLLHGFRERNERDNMNTKIAAAALSFLIAAAFFAVLQAEPKSHPPQAPSPSSDGESRSVWDGVYTEEQAERGHSVYHQQCELCHGDTLLGGDEVPPLSGAQFLANWNGLTVGDLFERIRKSMPANDPGRLTSQQNADVLAYLSASTCFRRESRNWRQTPSC